MRECAFYKILFIAELDGFLCRGWHRKTSRQKPIYKRLRYALDSALFSFHFFPIR